MRRRSHYDRYIRDGHSDSHRSKHRKNCWQREFRRIRHAIYDCAYGTAACECLAKCGLLADGQTSVGTEISAAHTAASPLGATITATAEITAVDGRKVWFEVTASDGTGEVGRGTHTRFIVDAERFMAKARGRV